MGPEQTTGELMKGADRRRLEGAEHRSPSPGVDSSGQPVATPGADPLPQLARGLVGEGQGHERAEGTALRPLDLGEEPLREDRRLSAPCAGSESHAGGLHLQGATLFVGQADGRGGLSPSSLLLFGCRFRRCRCLPQAPGLDAQHRQTASSRCFSARRTCRTRQTLRKSQKLSQVGVRDWTTKTPRRRSSTRDSTWATMVSWSSSQDPKAIALNPSFLRLQYPRSKRPAAPSAKEQALDGHGIKGKLEHLSVLDFRRARHRAALVVDDAEPRSLGCLGQVDAIDSSAEPDRPPSLANLEDWMLRTVFTEGELQPVGPKRRPHRRLRRPCAAQTYWPIVRIRRSRSISQSPWSSSDGWEIASARTRSTRIAAIRSRSVSPTCSLCRALEVLEDVVKPAAALGEVLIELVLLLDRLQIEHVLAEELERAGDVGLELAGAEAEVGPILAGSARSIGRVISEHALELAEGCSPQSPLLDEKRSGGARQDVPVRGVLGQPDQLGRLPGRAGQGDGADPQVGRPTRPAPAGRGGPGPAGDTRDGTTAAASGVSKPRRSSRNPARSSSCPFRSVVG